MNGKLIVIEGCCDGCGKSTQLEMLKEEFKDKCLTHHFPTYNNPCASLVESFLNGKLGELDNISEKVINAYYAMDREYIWRNYLKKEYNDGKIIILDRYTTSSLIYQTMGATDFEMKKDMISQIQAFEYSYLNIKDPDLVIFLDGEFDVINDLRLKRNNEKDIFEDSIDKQRKIYESAKIVCEYLKWYKINVTDNNNMRSCEDIHNDIMKLIRKRLK